jgi:hypothetical protein
MEFSTFDVIPKRKRIIVFKVGKLWLFKTKPWHTERTLGRKSNDPSQSMKPITSFQAGRLKTQSLARCSPRFFKTFRNGWTLL